MLVKTDPGLFHVLCLDEIEGYLVKEGNRWAGYLGEDAIGGKPRFTAPTFQKGRSRLLKEWKEQNSHWDWEGYERW